MSALPRFRSGDWVLWLPDADEGLVTGCIPGQALAIRWASTGQVEWYPIHCVALTERIAPLNADTADEIPT